MTEAWKKQAIARKEPNFKDWAAPGEFSEFTKGESKYSAAGSQKN